MGALKLKSWQKATIHHCFIVAQKKRDETRALANANASYIPLLKKWYSDPRDRAKKIVHFINNFCMGYDPRMAELGYPTTVPFMLTPHQEEYIYWLQDHFERGESGVTEKSRGEGMSWLWVYFAQFHWLFTKGFKAGFGTYKDNKLDELGNMDSLFEKFRYSLYRLPKDLRPEVFSPSIHDNHKRIINVEMETAITGEIGRNIGRGGRNSIYFVDEHAHLQHAEDAEMALSENTNCIMYGSTPYGAGNLFYKKVHTMKREDVFTFHWSTNPLKNKDWYADRKRRFDPVTLAQEVDIDYTASVEGIIIPARWVRASVGLELVEPHTNIREAGIDVGGGSKKAESVYIERLGSTVTRIEAERGKEPTDWAIHSANLGVAFSIQKYKYDSIGVGAGVGGTINKMEPRPQFMAIPVNGGAGCSMKKYDDNLELTAKDRFHNLRAEIWWNLRERFRKTYEYVNENKEYDLSELISIPNDQELITQLSQPLMEYSATGKVKVESKEDMAKRGVSSPDRADALVYCYADVTPTVIHVPY